MMTRKSYHQMIREKDEQIQLLVEQVKKLQATVEKQQRYIEQLLKRIYGDKSERFDPNQMHFDGMVIEAMDQAAEQTPEAPDTDNESHIEEKPARKNRGYNRLPIPEHVERKEIVRDLPEEEKKCKECGDELPYIGEDVTERLACVPLTLHVNRYVTPKYGECKCGHGECGVKAVIAEHALIERCNVEPSVIATVLTQKFFDHLPFYRQEYIFQRHGVELSRKTMWDWEWKVAEGLMPLWELLKEDALSAGVVLSDDTPVKMMEKSGGTREARIWVCLGGEKLDRCLYEFTLNRGQDGPKKFFKDYQGKLVADAYGGYEPLYETNKDITPSGCWAHTRRYFHESLPFVPGKASEMMALIGGLYRVERCAAEYAPDDRLELRQKEAVPQMEQISEWLKKHQDQWLPKSPMGEAMTYIGNQWTRLQVYLTDGRVPIDNNAAERAVKPWAIGRKNWLFFFSARGGVAAAIIMSFLQSCRLQGIEPWRYLQDVISRIAGHPASKLTELLPHAWKTSHPEAIIHTPA